MKPQYFSDDDIAEETPYWKSVLTGAGLSGALGAGGTMAGRRALDVITGPSDAATYGRAALTGGIPMALVGGGLGGLINWYSRDSMRAARDAWMRKQQGV
jgi:hypothetical protein